MKVKNMGYNHGKAEKLFQKQWQEKKERYIKLGMTKEQIDALYEADREEFNSDRRFYENNESLFDSERSNIVAYDEDYAAMDSQNWIEVISDQQAYLKIKSMPEIKRQAYELYKIYGYSQKEISSILLKSQQLISLWIGEIDEILKKSKNHW